MHRTRIDRNGRLLLPAPVRRQLGLSEGSELLIQVEGNDRVSLITPRRAWSLAQQLFDGARPQGSVVDELFAERRAEAKREDLGRDTP